MLLIIYLLLCLSLHACSARHLVFIDKRTVKGLQLPDKVETSIVGRLRMQEQSFRVGIDRKIYLSSWDGAKTMQYKNSEATGKESEENKGNNIVLPSPEEALQETAKAEDQKRQARSIMESPPSNEEETVNSKQNDMGEDIVVMDYAQPHRKTPIHNREP